MILTQIKRTSWGVLPADLHDAAKAAFPDCKSPRTIPDDKWAKLVVAYETWHHVLSSKNLFRESGREFTEARNYLIDIALKIASGEL